MKTPIINHILIIICGFYLSSATSLDTMLDPICQAKCLKYFKDSMEQSDNSENILKNPFLIKSFCLNDINCKGCMMACDKVTQPQDSCLHYCKTIPVKYQQSCSLSCVFINEKKINRPGICPEVKRKSQCSYQCNSDNECFKQGTKCCKSKLCNSTCQISEFPKHGVPPVPMAPLVRQIINEKHPDQIQFDLDWLSYNITSVNYPVLFVVQIRIGHLNEASNTVFDRWRNLISTSKSGVIISSIQLDTWYQFRLLAFSENGFKDFGEMTSPITVHYKFTNPVPPKNISEKVTRIINGKISITLTWQPGDSNPILPLSNYKISWKRVYELNENNPLVTEYEISIPATEEQYTIENLLPSASYMVKIVSMVVYKDEKYNSTATVYYISTASIPQPKSFPGNIESNIKENDLDCICGNSNILLPVDIEQSTSTNGQLAMHIKLKRDIEFDNIFAPYSFRIQWQPIACIESSYNSNIYPTTDEVQTIVVKNTVDHYLTNLRLHCNYKIEIELFSQLAKKIIKIWEGCFCTPSCNSHYSSSGKNNKSPCLNSEIHIPKPIDQLKVILKKSANKSNTDADLYWHSESTSPITSFRITWGPRLEEPIEETMYGKNFMPILDSGKAISKVVKYPIQKSTLKNLTSGKIYIVKLQVIDNYSTSRESSIFFKVHSDKNSSSKEKYQNYFLLFLTLFIVLYIN